MVKKLMVTAEKGGISENTGIPNQRWRAMANSAGGIVSPSWGEGKPVARHKNIQKDLKELTTKSGHENCIEIE